MYSMQSLGNYGHHTFYGSLLSPSEIVELAYQLGFRTVGIADVGGFWGAVEFSKACLRMGVRPIFGCRMSVSKLGGIQLTVKNQDGYRALSRYLTHWQKYGGEVPLSSFHFFWREFGGHFNLSVRPVPVRESPPDSSDWAVWKRQWEIYTEYLGPEFWIELQWNTAREQELQRRVYRELTPLTDRWVVMSGARYVSAEQWKVLRVLQALNTGTRLNQAHSKKLIPGDYALLAAESLRHRFGRVPHVLDKTQSFIEACSFDFEFDKQWFPRTEIQQNHAAQDERLLAAEAAGEFRLGLRNEHAPIFDSTRFRRLRYLCLRGIIRRYRTDHYPWKDAPRGGDLLRRIQWELALIRETGYTEYFLFYNDVVTACRRRGLTLTGYSESTVALVCYALGISNTCPFRFGLNVDRLPAISSYDYSNPGKIYLGLLTDQREEVIDVIYCSYGADQVAMVGGFIEFDSKDSISAIAKTMGITENESRYIERNLPVDAATIVRNRRAKRGDEMGAGFQSRIEEIRELVIGLDGLPRSSGIDPHRLTVACKPIADFGPLIDSGKKLLRTQLSARDLQDLGLLDLEIKDRLELKVVRDACRNIQEELGLLLQFDQIAISEPGLYRFVLKEHGRGMLHVESPVVLKLLRTCGCVDIDCLIGVLTGSSFKRASSDESLLYTKQLVGLEAAEPTDSTLKQILKNSSGLIVYKEHISEVAHLWAGMELRRARFLQRVVSEKGKRRELGELKSEFYSCAIRRDIDEAAINSVWQQLVNGSNEFLNRAHVAACALEALQSAYLKKHYAGYLYAAVLESAQGYYHPLVYVIEGLRCGYRFELPDVSLPFSRFWFNEDTIYAPVASVRDLSANFLDAWEREIERERFSDWNDFLVRVLPDQADLLLLARSGALRSFFDGRGEAVWNTKLYKRDDFIKGIAQLFKKEDFPETVPLEKIEAKQCAAWEIEFLGYPVSLSPFEWWLGRVDRGESTQVGCLGDFVGQTVEVVGIVSVAKCLEFAEKIVIVDESGFADVDVPPELRGIVVRLFTSPRAVRMRVVIDGDETENAFGVRLKKLVDCQEDLRERSSELACAI